MSDLSLFTPAAPAQHEIFLPAAGLPRSTQGPRWIAVAGEAGKTTLCHMIHAVLGGSSTGRVVDLQRGEQARRTDDYAVLEWKSVAAEKIAAPLIGVLLRPTAGRRYSPPAIETAEVRELIRQLAPEAWCVAAGDEACWPASLADRGLRVVRTGRGADCHLSAADVRCVPGELRFRVEGQLVRMPVWGRHHLDAALAALAVGRIMGVTLAAGAEALARFSLPERRCQVVRYRGAYVILDAFNTTFSAWRAALELLREFPATGRRVVIAGDLDVGPGGETAASELGSQIVTVCGADRLVACGATADRVLAAAWAAGMPRTRGAVCGSANEARRLLDESVRPGDVVLVKGADLGEFSAELG